MADEIIKLLEYLTNNPTLQGAAIAYIIIEVVMFIAVMAFFISIAVFIFKGFKNF